MSSIDIYTSPLCSCLICKQVKSAKGIHSHYLLHDDERMKIHKKNASSSHLRKNHPNSISFRDKMSEYERYHYAASYAEIGYHLQKEKANFAVNHVPQNTLITQEMHQDGLNLNLNERRLDSII